MCTKLVFLLCDMAAHITALPTPNLSTSWIQLAAKRSFFHLHVVPGTWIHCWTRLFFSTVVAILDASEPIGVCFDDAVGSKWHHEQDVLLLPQSFVDGPHCFVYDVQEWMKKWRLLWWRDLKCRILILQSWAAVVTLGRPDLGRSRVDRCCPYLSHIRDMVLWDTLKDEATSVCVSPASHQSMALFLWASFKRGIIYPFMS